MVVLDTRPNRTDMCGSREHKFGSVGHCVQVRQVRHVRHMRQVRHVRQVCQVRPAALLTSICQSAATACNTSLGINNSFRPYGLNFGYIVHLAWLYNISEIQATCIK